MSDLDQLSISRILGSTIQDFSRPAFGGFSAVRAAGEMLADLPRGFVPLAPDAARDAAITKAFKQAHQGYSVDRVLADPTLTGQFIRACREFGLTAPQVALSRRLLRLRKIGGFVKATKEDDRDLHPFLIPAELAFARLTYLQDVSYDDLLADPALGASFDALADRMGRGKGDRVDYRLAALHLRKNIRSRKAADAEKLAHIVGSEIDRKWRQLGPLSRVATEKLPTVEGILSLNEPTRCLYLTKFPSLREGIAVFRDAEVLSSLANRFWSPSPDHISVQVLKPEDMKGTSLRLVELKSLELYRPIFNMLPVAA